MPASASSLSLATFMVLCPTSFFLGILFSLFPYDYPLLWSRDAISPDHLVNLETHLKLLYNSPNLIQRIFHIVTGLGLTGLIIKLYKPSESNFLFDGGSLVLYMIAVIIYITNIIKGLRIVDEGSYGLVNMRDMSLDQLDAMDSMGNDPETGYSVLGKEDNLKVLAASNTITALVLVGVVVLQVGQWYADRADQKEREKAKIEGEGAKLKKTTSATPASPVEGDEAAGSASGSSRKTGAKEGKKHR